MYICIYIYVYMYMLICIYQEIYIYIYTYLCIFRHLVDVCSFNKYMGDPIEIGGWMLDLC